MGRGFLCLKFLLLSVLISALVGCGGVQVTDYADRDPAFDARDFFNGFLTAHGVVKNYQGRATRHFNAEIDACWRDGVGTLDERFVFDDGERQTRIWTLKPQDNGRFVATAGDVVGPGTASSAGNAFFLDYVLRVALEDGTIDLRIDDRMYRVSENVVINESSMSKWGLPVGEILLTIIRHPDRDSQCRLD